MKQTCTYTAMFLLTFAVMKISEEEENKVGSLFGESDDEMLETTGEKIKTKSKWTKNKRTTSKANLSL